MTRTAAAARVARSRNFGNGCESARGDLGFNGAFGNKKARTDQRFIAGPIIARRIAVLPNRSQQRITRELRAMLSFHFESRKLTLYECVPILPDDSGFGSRDIHNPLGQQ